VQDRREKHYKPGQRNPKPNKPLAAKEDWVPIELPENLEEMFEHWAESDRPNVGWCLLCDSAIGSADDLIPGTSTHNCEAGRALDEKIRGAEQAAKADRKITPDVRRRSSHHEPVRRKLAAEPEVGIFWFLDRQLIVDSTPLSHGEPYANSLTHPKGHPRRWVELQAAGSVPLEIEYDEIPRGRVTYDCVEDRFMVFRDRCIPVKVIREVIGKMHLPKDRTVVAGDPHYRCPRCLKSETL